MFDPLSDLPGNVIDQVRARYREPHRAYHDWSHIEALLGHYRQLGDQLADPLAVGLAVLFHDAHYDPRASDNEQRSAELMMALLSGRCDATALARAHDLIMATCAHAMPADVKAGEARDMALFLDMDLAILGADKAAFDRYEAGVRREYTHVSDEAFKAGRAAVLNRFASRPSLYFSAWGKTRFEARARANLARSLAPDDPGTAAETRHLPAASRLTA